MMGLFDSMFGGAGVYKDMLDPETMRQVQQQSQLAMAAQLLAAGGPSTSPTSLGQALGKGVMAGQQAQQGGVTNAVQGMLMKQKMDEYKRDLDIKKRYAEMFAGGTPTPNQPSSQAMTQLTPQQALLATGMPVGPTKARAAMIGQPVPTGAMPAGQSASLQSFVASLNPTQRSALSMMSPKEGMAKVLELQQLQQQRVRPMTAQELQQFGLPPGTSAGIDGMGKPTVLRQRPAPIIMDTPSGGKVLTTEAALLNMTNPQPPSLPGGAGASIPAPAVDGRPVAAQADGLPPGMVSLMAPALKPEQIIVEARDWDKNYRAPVMNAIQSFSTVKDLIQNGQGGIADYGIVIKAIKALDDTSAVMQGEADSAKSMMSLADRMQSLMNQAAEGGLGSEQARMQLANLARSAVKSAVNVYNSQLERKRKIYGSRVDAATLDAMLQQIEMPAGAENPEALGAAVGRTSSGVALMWDPKTQQWVTK
jgi:hypothetical protein